VTDGGWEIRCNACGAAVPSTAETCPECGTVLLGPASLPPIAMSTTTVSEAGPSMAVASSLTWAPRVGGAGRSYEVGHWGFGGFWIRVVAWLVDYVVGAVAVAVARAVFGPIGVLLVLPLLLLYYPLLESSGRQATFGKQICGLAVTDSRGERISFGRGLARQLAKFLSAMALGVGFLMVAFTDRKRGLHDMIAGTLVVRR